ncbi:hypothetical protein DWX78_14975 [Dorea formicigenerans]|nr:hypothetical protein DWX78_14975 [Dorea formicigenerans]
MHHFLYILFYIHVFNIALLTSDINHVIQECLGILAARCASCNCMTYFYQKQSPLSQHIVSNQNIFFISCHLYRCMFKLESLAKI